MYSAVGMRPCASLKSRIFSLAFKPALCKPSKPRTAFSKQLTVARAAGPEAGAPGADTESTGPLTLVQFSVPLQVQFQEQVCVTGGAPSLGNWDAEAALPLKWSEGDHWVGECELPRGAPVEYKYVIRTLDSGTIWQEGDANLSVPVPTRALHIFVQDTWDMTEHTATVLDAEKVDWKRLPLSVEELEAIIQAEEGLGEEGVAFTADSDVEGYQAEEGVEAGVQETEGYAQGYEQQGQYYVPGLDPALSSGEFYTDGMGDVVAWDPAVGEEYAQGEGSVADGGQAVHYEQEDGTECYAREGEPAEALYAGDAEGQYVDPAVQYDEQQQYEYGAEYGADGQYAPAEKYAADGQYAPPEQYAAGGQYTEEGTYAGYSGGVYDPDSNEYLPNQIDYSQPVYNSYEDPEYFGIEARVVYDGDDGIYQPESDEYAPKPDDSQAAASAEQPLYADAFNFENTNASLSEEPQGPYSTLPPPPAATHEEGEDAISANTAEEDVAFNDAAEAQAPVLTVDGAVAEVKVDDTGAATFVFATPDDKAAEDGNKTLEELPPFVLSSRSAAQQSVQAGSFERAVTDAGAVQKEFPEPVPAESEQGGEPVDLASLTYGELQQMCKARGLRFYGRKADLLKRLREAQAVA